MDISDIRKMPTSSDRMHESVFRAFHIVGFVHRHLRNDASFSRELLLEIMEDLMNAPGSELKLESHN